MFSRMSHRLIIILGFNVDRVNKVLDYKTYNKIGHLSGSRLGESDSHIDANTERILTVEFPNNKKYILWIEEKMDGSNVCVVRLNGELRTLSRSGYDCSESNQEQHRMFHRWVMANKEAFNILLPGEHDRVVGEWLALAHGTLYKDLSSPFMAFDLYRNKIQQPTFIRREEVRNAGLCNVPHLHVSFEAVPVEKALGFLADPNAEGIIYRLEKKNKGMLIQEGTPHIIAKVVKHDKVDGLYLAGIEEKYFKWNWIEPCPQV